MPATDYAAIIEVPAPPPLNFRPIDDAPVPPGKNFGPCLLALEDTHGPDWTIGCWDGERWYNAEGDQQLSPAWWAPLPPVPRKPEQLSRLITAVLNNGEHDYAERLIKQLLDEVRALRDRPRHPAR